MTDSKNTDKSCEKTDLRSRAEDMLRQRDPEAPKATDDNLIHRAVHELQVHQMELEMQNEELRKAQTELAASQSRYVELYDFAPVGYFLLDRKGVIIEANLAGAAMLGIERKWLVGKPFNVFVAKENQDAFYRHRQKVLAGGDVDTCELAMVRKDGSKIHAMVATRGPGSDAGEDARYKTVVMDITAAKLT